MLENNNVNYHNSANVTVITVCFNAEKEIEKTIKSVLNQTDEFFEYVIVDGLSRDKTVEIANSYKSQFDKKGIIYRIISEKDNGIYNAMNKGTKLASRDWLIFLNAGDYFTDGKTLESINKYCFDDSDIVYGDAIEELDTPSRLRGIKKARPLEMIETGMVFCHQSAFIKRSLLMQFPYDETYKISGDYNFFFGSYKKGRIFKHIDEIIAVFTLGGASSNLSDHILEDVKVKYTWGELSKTEYENMISSAERKKKVLVIREKLKKILPRMVFYKIQENKYRKMGFCEEKGDENRFINK